MTAATPEGDAAWTALLPGGTIWLSRPPRRAGVAAGFATAAAPWSLRRRRGRGARAYIAVPSRRRPLIVASWDRAVLRYLADTVLSVPPGGGQLRSAVLTLGLRLLGTAALAAGGGAPGRRCGPGREDRMTMAPPRTLTAFIDQAGGRAACLAMSRDPNAKVTILLFPPGAARPAYVAKVPTTDAAARSVEREAERLAEVHDRVTGPVSATIPKLVATVEHLRQARAGHDRTARSVDARRLSLLAAHGPPRGGGADFAAAGDWLAGLHGAVAGNDTGRPASRRCWTESRTCSAAGSTASREPTRTWPSSPPCAGGSRPTRRRNPWSTATSGSATCSRQTARCSASSTGSMPA